MLTPIHEFHLHTHLPSWALSWLGSTGADSGTTPSGMYWYVLVCTCSRASIVVCMCAHARLWVRVVYDTTCESPNQKLGTITVTVTPLLGNTGWKVRSVSATSTLLYADVDTTSCNFIDTMVRPLPKQYERERLNRHK